MKTRTKTATSYTVMEYNTRTRSYTTLGSASACSASEACELFAKESGWKPAAGTRLFARIPICR